MIDRKSGSQMWQITPEVIERVVRTIRDQFQPERIILFGSAATGNLRSGSDLDLLIVMRSDLPPFQRAMPIRLALRPSPCPMDILVFTPEEFEKWNGVPGHIVTEAYATGRVVYDRAA